MRRVPVQLMLCCLLAAIAVAETKSNVGSWPRGGTINVVVANSNGVVVLTDSMLTEFRLNPDGSRSERQLTGHWAQKLFRIDDKTVCAFAGFASAPTDPLPEFLNRVPLIIGRYEDRLRGYEASGPLSFADKLSILEQVAAYYLTGIANIRDGTPADDYRFQLFLAGYDRDGTLQIGTLELGTVGEQIAAGQYLRSVTVQKSVIPIKDEQIICIHGMDRIARGIIDGSADWKSDDGPCARSTGGHALLPVDQMKALAVSLKQKTADQFKEVGGPSQIAILASGRIREPIEQPVFPPITLSKFKFQIIATFSAINEPNPKIPESLGKPTGYAFISDGFTLVLADQFIHTRVALDDAYFAKNVIRDCVLTYRGREVHLEKSNQVIDSDLEVAAGVSKSSPTLQQLLHDFHWRTVTYDVQMPPDIQQIRTQGK